MHYRGAWEVQSPCAKHAHAHTLHCCSGHLLPTMLCWLPFSAFPPEQSLWVLSSFPHIGTNYWPFLRLWVKLHFRAFVNYRSLMDCILFQGIKFSENEVTEESGQLKHCEMATKVTQCCLWGTFISLTKKLQIILKTFKAIWGWGQKGNVGAHCGWKGDTFLHLFFPAHYTLSLKFNKLKLGWFPSH